MFLLELLNEAHIDVFAPVKEIEDVAWGGDDDYRENGE
jgi:hypothetical protein